MSAGRIALRHCDDPHRQADGTWNALNREGWKPYWTSPCSREGKFYFLGMYVCGTHRNKMVRAEQSRFIQAVKSAYSRLRDEERAQGRTRSTEAHAVFSLMLSGPSYEAEARARVQHYRDGHKDRRARREALLRALKEAIEAAENHEHFPVDFSKTKDNDLLNAVATIRGTNEVEGLSGA